MNGIRAAALGTTSIFAIGLSLHFGLSTAVAQTETAATPTEDAEVQPVENDEAAIEEIVVTARKREERLQNVPVAVTALTGKQLSERGITSSRDLFQVVPGLTFTQGGNQPQIQIRGVGTRGSGPGDEPAVPVYIDGIYQATQLNSLFNLGGIQRVEVLKGPQGTLFGRNAAGGAINIVTLDPEDELRVEASVGYASLNQRTADLFIASPVSDTLSVSLSVHADQDDGYVRNVFLNKTIGVSETFSVRGKAIWRPSEKADVSLIGFYVKYNDNSPQGTSLVGLNSVAFLPARGGSPTITYTNAPRTTAAGSVPYNDNETYGGAIIGRFYFDDFDLTALASYQNSTSETYFDLTQAPPPVSNIGWEAADEVYTAEVRATSNGEGPFQWIVGAYYFNGTNGYPLQVTNGATLVNPRVTVNENKTNAYAFFAEGTYAFLENWELTLGVRYSEESRDQTVATGTIQGLGALNTKRDVRGLGTVVLGTPVNGSTTFTNTAPRITLKYAFTPDTQLYATYTEGFKSGLYNASTFTNPLVPVEAETLSAYQVGFKSMLAPNLRLNAEAFSYKYEGMQINVRSSAGITQLQNAANASIYGAEASLDWAVTRDWSINLGVAYTHSEFDDFANAIAFRPFTAGDPGAAAQRVVINGVPTYVGNFTDNAFNATGNQLPKTPLWTANLATTYAIPLSDGGRVVLAGDVFVSSNYFFNSSNTLGTGDYSIINLSAAWELPGGHLKVTTYVTNLGDTELVTFYSESGNGSFLAWNRPRMFGVTFSYSL